MRPTRTSVGLVLALLLWTSRVFAQSAVCDPEKRACGCEENWGCWQLVYASKGTVLGFRGTLMQLERAGDPNLEASVLTAYASEHYGTRRGLAGHFRAFGSIGGGTVGNEGSLGGSLDFGYRHDDSPVSGYFLRAGPTGMLLGNRQLWLSLLEPVQLRAGYQVLDGDTLLEAGFTSGMVVVGRFDPGKTRRRELTGSPELGSYVAVHFEQVRFDASYAHYIADAAGPRGAVDMVRGSVCAYPRPFALCLDFMYVHGETQLHGRNLRDSSLIYPGLTLGLTP